MLKLHVLVLEKDLDALTLALGDAGFVHLVDAVGQSKDRLLEGVDRGRDIEKLQRLAQTAETLAANLGLSAVDMAVPAADLSLAEIESFLREVGGRFRKEDETINSLLKESGTLTREVDRLDAYPFRRVRFGSLRDLNHLYIATGRMSPAVLPDLAATLGEKALVLHDFDPATREERVLVLGGRRNRWAIESELGKTGFGSQELPAECDGSAAEEGERVSTKLAQILSSVEQHHAAVLSLGERYAVRLAAVTVQVRNGLAMARAQQSFGKAAHLYCISGWIPADAESRVREVASEVTRGTAILEALAPQEDELVQNGSEPVPVKFAAIPALAPFQKMVSTFGAPRYQEIEPSLYVAVSFVLMFGLMFGDVGQGAVIASVGVYLLRSRNSSVMKIKDAGYMLLFCGLSAVLFGFLYGSLFGNEHWLRAVPLTRAMALVEPLRDVLLLFKIAIVVGVACISGGIIINIVNKIRARQYFEGILDKFGVIGIVFYWGSLGLGLKAFVAKELNLNQVTLFVVLPLAVLFVREPLHNILARKDHILEEDVFSFVLSSCMEVMETLTTFLGSTVSFIRLGGFALSHAAVCLAIYSMVDVIRDLPGSGLWAVLIVVVGNVFVILLEGMVVTIQGIRLQYYELFSKYFAGDGVLYAPFRLGTSGSRKQTEER